jgi:hypothetical protein
MIPLEKVPDRSKLVQPEVMMPPILADVRKVEQRYRTPVPAKDWDSSPPPTAVKKAGTPAGWEVNAPNPFRQRGTPATSSAS